MSETRKKLAEVMDGQMQPSKREVTALACGNRKVIGLVTILTQPTDVLQMCVISQKMREVILKTFYFVKI